MKHKRDSIDDFIDQWRAARPDLDPEVMGVFGRMGRLWTHALRGIEATLAPWKLQLGEFDVLATVRRAGPPCVVTPSELTRSLMLSPSGITSRLDRLEKLSLIERRPSPSDRRSLLVVLTPAGKKLVDEAITAHVANEHRMLSALSASERKTFDSLLRRFLESFESGATNPDRS